MSELDELMKVKKNWLDKYQSYAYTLCLAILDIGEADNLGDPDSIRRHHMTARSLKSGVVKIIATEKSGGFVPALNKYADTRRLIVKVLDCQPVYMTFTDDPSIEDAQNNIFVPGVWMDYSDHVIALYTKNQLKAGQEFEDNQVRKLKTELLIDVPTFGTQYEKKE